ncbi:hypothetical protein L687_15110 [Microbacterium maritypicum MF109]|uniref:Uncharacterized protein n=1 Tax=Microbacterium maritypicum MF109 TaxID=1333857 RepID=T5KMT8_MICMQ|nr:hypothetical protein L687_15110 [Microbacterium maritypicum MF109]
MAGAVSFFEGLRPAHVRLHDGEPVRLRPAVAAKKKVL